MSNKQKNLLSESSVRRFMKLASIQPLGGFLKERFEEEVLDEEEQIEEEQIEEMGMAYNRDDEEEELPGEEASEEEPELPAEDAPAEAAPEMEQFAKEVAQSLADAIEQASGGAISVSVEGGEDAPADEPAMEEPEMEEPAMEEPEMDEPAMEEPEMEEPEEEEPELAESDEIELSLTEDEEERIVNEVYKRIARKILKNKLASKNN